MKKLINGQVVDMTPEEVAEFQEYEQKFANQVPQTVTRYQAMMALKNAGLLNDVRELIAGMEEDADARIAWENATIFDRQSPFIAALAPALELTEDQIDDLFRAAAQIT